MTRHQGFLAGAVLALGLAGAPGCLWLPADVRTEAEAAAPPAPNHFAPAPPGAGTDLAARLVAEPVPPAAATRAPATSGRWPPSPGGFLRRPQPPPDAAWPPPFVPRHGQLLATEQGSAQGIFLSLFARDAHPFVHTGLVAHEGNAVVVYETTGVLRAEIGGTPASRVGGGVRRVPWAEFARNQRFVAVFDPPAGVDADRAVAYARGSLGVPFDARFDATDDTALYCNELTARALAAGGVARVPALFTANPSLRTILDWLGVRGDALYTPASVTAGLEPVAIVSRWHSPRQITAYFAAKAELQRRFTADQKIGNVITYSPFTGLRLREPVQAFLAAVDAEAAAWPDEDDAVTRERVRALARAHLGAFDAAR